MAKYFFINQDAEMGPARLTSVRRGYAPHNNHFSNPTLAEVTFLRAHDLSEITVC